MDFCVIIVLAVFLIFQNCIGQARILFILKEVKSMGVYKLATTSPSFKVQSLIQVMCTH